MGTTSMRQSILVSVVVTILALAAYLVIAAFIPPPPSGLPLIGVGVLLALVPAVVWLVFFYQRDNVEPEPKRLVARMFLFGGLAGMLAVPLSETMFRTAIDPLHSVTLRFVVTVLSVSLIQEILKLGMVRYVVLGTDEFDEHPDGIVYGLAVGLGLATVFNIDFVIRADGVLPLQGAILATNNALIHGSLGALTGYVVGRVKLDGERLVWLAGGLAISTVVNGAYHTVSSEVTSLGFSFQPGYALVVAGVLALGIGVVLFAMFQRAHSLAAGQMTTITQQAQARSVDMPWDIAPRYDNVLLVGLIVALAVGWGTGLFLDTQTTTFESSDLPVSLSYPSSWAVEQTTGGLRLTDLESGAAFAPTLQMTGNKVAAGAQLEQLAQERVLRLEQQLDFFQVTSRSEGPLVGGHPSLQREYTYVARTASGPEVVRGLDTMVLYDNRLYTFRLQAEEGDFADSLGRYEGVLRTVRFR